MPEVCAPLFTEDQLQEFESDVDRSCYRYRQTKCDKGILGSEHRAAARSLLDDSNLIITELGTSVGIALLNRLDYITEMNAILRDGTEL